MVNIFGKWMDLWIKKAFTTLLFVILLVSLAASDVIQGNGNHQQKPDSSKILSLLKSKNKTPNHSSSNILNKFYVNNDEKTVREVGDNVIPIRSNELTEHYNVQSGTAIEGVDGEQVAQRVKRMEDCPESPPGVSDSCIPCSYDKVAQSLKFQHTDKYGNSCICELCPQIKYLKECICTENGGRIQECLFTVLGETYMTHPNKCPKPFNCTKQCPDTMVIVDKCQHNKDSQCGCADGFYQIGETTCEEKPRCPVNYELKEIRDDKYSSYSCKPCPDGFVQPKDNSRDKCFEALPTTETVLVPQQDQTDAHTVTGSTQKKEESSEASTSIPTAGIQESTTKHEQKSTNSILNLGAEIALIVVTLFVLIIMCAAIVSFKKHYARQEARHHADRRQEERHVEYNQVPNGDPAAGPVASIQPLNP